MTRKRTIVWAIPLIILAFAGGCDSSNEAVVEDESEVTETVLAAPVRRSDMIATARNGISIDLEAVPEPIPKVVGADRRTSRNYPMQPPLIPHDIRGYEVNLQSNTCMACHSRREVSETQATMISVTHYMDRQGNFLAEISPRRYFCQQCHIVQTTATELVGSSFEDMDDLIQDLAEAEEN